MVQAELKAAMMQELKNGQAKNPGGLMHLIPMMLFKRHTMNQPHPLKDFQHMINRR